MSDTKTFSCPSCYAPMAYKGGESLFQNCEACLAPIVVPDDIYYDNRVSLAYDKFASLNNDIDVDVEQVTNELTAGDSLPESSIGDGLGFDVVIEKFDEYQEKIGIGTVAEKEVFDDAVSTGGDDVLKKKTLLELTPQTEQTTALDLIRSELEHGHKIEAIKIYREAYGVDLKTAKHKVEAMERG